MTGLRAPPVLHLICGSTGAGKTRFARRLGDEVEGIVFSIDAWMTTLFWMDSPQPIAFDWAIERVIRCEDQIKMVALAALGRGVPAILDLGFTTREQRARIGDFASAHPYPLVLHVLEVPADVRWARVEQRNLEQGETFAMPVDRGMFDFVETLWQPPDAAELAAMNGIIHRD